MANCQDDTSIYNFLSKDVGLETKCKSVKVRKPLLSDAANVAYTRGSLSHPLSTAADRGELCEPDPEGAKQDGRTGL